MTARFSDESGAQAYPAYIWRSANPPLDVDEARRLALDLEAGDPTVEHYSVDGSDAALWAGVLACLVCILLGCGLALVVVQTCRHWRGILELVLAAFIVLGCWPKRRYNR